MYFAKTIIYLVTSS